MITKEQIEKRKSFIGSSDVPAILGVDPFRSITDVFYEKVGKLEPQKESPVMTRGRYLEHALLLFAQHFLGGHIIKQGLEKTFGLIIDHPDGIFKPNKRPVEAKSQNFFSKEEWGEEGTGEVPLRVAAQCLIHLYVWEQDLCYVPADLPYRGLQMFEVARDRDVIQTILEKCQEFWEKYVLKDTPPPAMPSMDTIKRMRRQPKSVIQLPDTYCSVCQKIVSSQEIIIENGLSFHKVGQCSSPTNTGGRLTNIGLVNVREAALTKEKEAKAEFDKADLALKTALGDAEMGTFDGGIVEFFNYHRKGYAVKETDYRKINIKLDKEK